MIQLERHIEILLLSCDCVIVPGFGGFMAHHVDAKFDDRDCSFLPPTRTIGFNPQLTMNDSLLVQSYIEAYDISYPEALKRIEDEVRELRQRLESEGRYEMNDLGVLHINNEGNIEFEPCEAGILTPCYYGLGAFQMLPLSMLADTAKTTSPVSVAEKERSATAIIAAETEPTTEKQHDSAKTISIRISVLRNIAVACIAIVFFMLFSSPVSDTPSSMLSQSRIDTGLLHRIMPREATGSAPKLTKAQLTKATENKGNAFKKEEAAATPTTPTEKGSNAGNISEREKKPYVIVLASHVTKSNAKSFASAMRKKGYESTRALIGEGVTKVVYGNYASKEEALKSLNQLRDITEFRESWILKTK